MHLITSLPAFWNTDASRTAVFMLSPPPGGKEKVTTGGKLLLALILLAQIKKVDISNLF